MAGSCDAVDFIVTRLISFTVSRTAPNWARSFRLAWVIAPLHRTLMPMAASPKAREAEKSERAMKRMAETFARIFIGNSADRGESAGPRQSKSKLFHLLRPQRGHRRHAGRAVGWEEAGEKRRGREHEARRDEREQIVRTHFVEDLGKHPTDGQGEEQSEHDGKSGLHRALAHDQAEDIAPSRSQRHANSNLARS